MENQHIIDEIMCRSRRVSPPYDNVTIMAVLLFFVAWLGVIALVSGFILAYGVHRFIDTELADREPIPDIKRMMTTKIFIPRRLLSPLGRKLHFARTLCLATGLVIEICPLALPRFVHLPFESAPAQQPHSTSAALTPALLHPRAVLGLAALACVAGGATLAAIAIPRCADPEQLGMESNGAVARISRSTLLPRRVLTPTGRIWWWTTIACWVMTAILMLLINALHLQ